MINLLFISGLYKTEEKLKIPEKIVDTLIVDGKLDTLLILKKNLSQQAGLGLY